MVISAGASTAALSITKLVAAIVLDSLFTAMDTDADADAALLSTTVFVLCLFAVLVVVSVDSSALVLVSSNKGEEDFFFVGLFLAIVLYRF
jgi:hypothetical protein